MLNPITTKNKLSLRLFAAVAVLLLFAFPDSAMAAGFSCIDGNMGLFKTIACKVTTTLYDIRKIVYIIAGFGLIAFTFAAIFNKISFKHLSNIALSLFLLSMMTPFIEYFTQDGGHTLTFHDKLPTSFDESDWTTDKPCTPETCPKMEGILGAKSDADLFGGGVGGVKVGSGIGGIKVGAGGLPGIGGGGLGMATEPADNRTGWQKLKDGVKKVAGHVRDAKNAATAAAATISNVVNSTKTVANAIKNTDFKKPNDIFNTIKSAASEVKSVTASVTSGAGTIGDIYFDKDGQKSAGQKTDEFFQSTNEAANDAIDVTGDVGETYNHISTAGEVVDTVTRPFKN